MSSRRQEPSPRMSRLRSRPECRSCPRLSGRGTQCVSRPADHLACRAFGCASPPACLARFQIGDPDLRPRRARAIVVGDREHVARAPSGESWTSRHGPQVVQVGDINRGESSREAPPARPALADRVCAVGVAAERLRLRRCSRQRRMRTRTTMVIGGARADRSPSDPKGQFALPIRPRAHDRAEMATARW